MKIGKNMRKIREKHGWSQTYVSKQLKVGSTTYCRWENDGALPDIYMIMNIANVFGVTLDELCEFTVNKKNKLNAYDEAIYCLKNAGINFEVESDVVKMKIYGISYTVNVSDLPKLISEADIQYGNLIEDINKGLYSASIAFVLNKRLAEPRKLSISNKAVLIEKLGVWVKQHKGKITLKAVTAWVKDDFIFMSIPARKRTWNEILKILLKEKLINKEDKNLWKCPFVEP